MCVIGLGIVFIYSSLLRTSADAGMNIRRECCAIIVSQMTSERPLKPSRYLRRGLFQTRRAPHTKNPSLMFFLREDVGIGAKHRSYTRRVRFYMYFLASRRVSASWGPFPPSCSVVRNSHDYSSSSALPHYCPCHHHHKVGYPTNCSGQQKKAFGSCALKLLEMTGIQVGNEMSPVSKPFLRRPSDGVTTADPLRNRSIPHWAVFWVQWPPTNILDFFRPGLQSRSSSPPSAESLLLSRQHSHRHPHSLRSRHCGMTRSPG